MQPLETLTIKVTTPIQCFENGDKTVHQRLYQEVKPYIEKIIASDLADAKQDFIDIATMFNATITSYHVNPSDQLMYDVSVRFSAIRMDDAAKSDVNHAVQAIRAHQPEPVTDSRFEQAILEQLICFLDTDPQPTEITDAIVTRVFNFVPTTLLREYKEELWASYGSVASTYTKLFEAYPNIRVTADGYLIPQHLLNA